MGPDLDSLVSQADPLFDANLPTAESPEAREIYERALSGFASTSSIPRRTRRVGMSLAGAALVSIALALAVILSQQASPTSASAELKKVGAAAGRQPGTTLAPGEWSHSVRHGVVQLPLSDVNGVPVPASGTSFTITLETWVSSSGSVALREEFSDPQFASSAAKTSWLAAGLPLDFTSHTHLGFQYVNGSGSAALNVANLPTQSQELSSVLEAGRTGISQIDRVPPGPSAVGERVLLLLLGPDSGATPALDSALLQVLSEVPGVDRLGTVATHGGRSGSGFALADLRPSEGRTIIVINPKTGALMEVRDLPLVNEAAGFSSYAFTGAILDQVLNQLAEPKTLGTSGGVMVTWITASVTDETVKTDALPPGINFPLPSGVPVP